MNPLHNGSAIRRPSRRTLLKAGAAGLAAWTAGTRFAAAEPVEGKDNHDVIVIGAGFAGVTAARQLCAAGRRTLLLEARDRLGGRTWTDRFDGERIELGGTWVHEGQPHVWRELQRYRIPVVADAPPERAIFPSGEGFRSFSPGEAFGRQGDLLAKFYSGAEDYFPRPYEPFTREDLLRPLDQLSVRARLDQLGLSREDESWVTGLLGGLAGTSSRGAMTQLAHWWALSDYSAEKYYSLNTWRPQTGMIGLLGSMLLDASPTVQLNAPVAEIHDNGTRVRVVLKDGRAFVARAAVVAVPVNVWRPITFKPGLPVHHQAVTKDTIGVPHVRKLWMRLRGNDLGRFFAYAPEGSPLHLMVTHSQEGDTNMVTAFSVDPTLNINDRAQVERAVRQSLPGAEVLAVRGQNWGQDPYSLGGWSCRRPGQLVDRLRSVLQPFGRLAFAGGDIATGWSGYVDGAIESGLRAADQVLEMGR